MMSRAAVVALTLLGLSLASGCGGDDADGAPEPVLPTADLSMTAEPTVDPADPADPATWTVRPGAIGPIVVGMTASDLRALKLVRPTTSDSCDFRWEAAKELVDLGIYLDFRDGDPDDLDQIYVGTGEPGSSTWETADGVAIGDPVSDLADAAGAPLARSTPMEEGGPMSISTYFGPDGALSVPDQDGTVASFFLTRGTDESTFEPPVTGC